MSKLRSGWEPIPEASRRAIWDRFYDDFSFVPSVHTFPGIKEPIPSLTFSTQDAHYDRRADQPYFESGFTEMALRICKALAGSKGLVKVLDWQHPCYYFDPSQYDGEWEIPPLPDGDYYIFLSNDMKNGWFGHPWEQTVCIFGNLALEAAREDPPWWFQKPIRKDGVRCCPNCSTILPSYIPSCSVCGMNCGRNIPPKRTPRM